MQPTIYIVAGPIGNLGDITLRALETLRQVEWVIAEDTRVTRRLLDRYGIDKPVKSLHEHSEDEKINTLLRGVLDNGICAAYLTDAGTPNVSDPGGRLVAMARTLDIDIVPLPGPSALTAILQVAGVPASQFIFLGYLPRKKGRQTLFKKLKDNSWPVVFFERGNRIVRTLTEFGDTYNGDTMIMIGREMTKKFEEFKSFKLSDLGSQALSIKGEFTILLAPTKKSQ